MTIIVEMGDLTRIKCDAVVNPANSFGFMGGGVAGAIKRMGGTQIENEAIGKAPIPVGSAIFTTAGNLPCSYVIHAPTMEQPAMRISIENVKIATLAALKLGVEIQISSIAIPGMGTGVGGVPASKAAEAIVDIAKGFEKKIDKIILIDRNQEMVSFFKKFI